MNFNAQYRRSRAYEGHANSVYQFRTEAEGFTNSVRPFTVMPSMATSQQQFFDPLTVNAFFGKATSTPTALGDTGFCRTAYTTLISAAIENTTTSTTAPKYGVTLYGTGIYTTLRGISITDYFNYASLNNHMFINNATQTVAPLKVGNIWRYEHI